MWLLAKSIAVITRQPRQLVIYGVDFKWADKSWTHNVFRLYEVVCGRRIGIRAEMSVSVREGVSTYTCHSWEATFALREQYLRAFLRKLATVRISVPILQTPQGFVFIPYVFAIALDTSLGVSGASTSYTCTGTNLILVLSSGAYASSPSAATYNSIPMTLLQDQAQAGVNGNQLYILPGPATGAHTLALTGGAAIDAASYTGAAQAGQPDSSNKAGLGAASSITVSTTVVASNCWLVGGAAGSSSTAITGGTGTTVRATDTQGGAVGDSNATVGTGSQSLVFNDGVQLWAATIASIAPAAATIATLITPTLLLLNVG